jgi:8-oxo-dGTP pyrophosphatase MutT (NUDIX family)
MTKVDENCSHIFHDMLDYFAERRNHIPDPISHPDRAVNSMVEGKENTLRKASVLIAASRLDGRNDSQIVLTLRSKNLNSHAGQISLPGGSQDPQDKDVVDTALRESEEEIGLDRKHVEVIGRLGDLSLPSGFHVTPIVALIESELEFTPCPIEVAQIFHAPLSLVLDLDAYKSSSMTFNKRQHKVLELHHGEHRIWGATAAILYHLAKEVNEHK